MWEKQVTWKLQLSPKKYVEKEKINKSNANKLKLEYYICCNI